MSRHKALVTGSTSGFGLAIACDLAKRGCDIILTGFASDDVIQKLKTELSSENGVQVNYIPADLSRLADIEQLCAKVTEIYPDGIDILINNAGFFQGGHVLEISDEAWDVSLAVMLSAPFHLIKRLVPAMVKKGWGRIINLSSQMGLVSRTDHAAYSAAKSGLIGLTKGVALDLATSGVTCNAVCPSFARTPLLESAVDTISKETGQDKSTKMMDIVKSVPNERWVTVEQVADLIQFLCLSEASQQMTGASYPIDGGYTAK